LDTLDVVAARPDLVPAVANEVIPSASAAAVATANVPAIPRRKTLPLGAIGSSFLLTPADAGVRSDVSDFVARRQRL
jgi:hypothetical protein